MAKSRSLSTYNVEGKIFQFNQEAFKHFMTSASSRKDSEGKPLKARVTKTKLYDQIADKIGDIEPASIKNWEMGYNSPRSIDYIQVCAEVLKVDLMQLLSPADDQKEVIKLKDKEVTLIEKIYEECINSMYLLHNVHKKLTGNPKEDSQIRHQNEAEYLEKLSGAHKMVDATLLISASVRYRLHRILNDMGEKGLFIGLPDRWTRINLIELDDHSRQIRVATEDEMFDYTISPSREGGSFRQGYWYFESEKELAEKLGYKYTDIPEAYWDDDQETMPKDSDGTPKKMIDVCQIEDADFEMDANILLKDMMTRYIKMVFANDFPELDIPESYFD